MSMKKSLSDDKWMDQAVRLARRGLGKTRPNPPVGAVVVRRGRIVGRGYHKRAGMAHAEVMALREAGERAKGSDLYITLEPCSTFGRTPPCTVAILASGISRVVVSVLDPNPVHHGKGVRLLRRAGINVTVGVLAAEGAALIAPFAKWIRTGLPYVTLKLGTSMDGRISDIKGRSRWITSNSSRRLMKRIRAGVDAIMVGAGTVRADDPSLLAPGKSAIKPLRVIVASRGRVPFTARVVCDGVAKLTVFATTRLCRSNTAEALARAGAEVWRLPDKDGRVSIRALLTRLGQQGCLHVLCEGGGVLAESLVRERLVDEIVFILAPRILGGSASAAAISGRGWPLRFAPRLQFVEVCRSGVDILVRCRLSGESRARRR